LRYKYFPELIKPCLFQLDGRLIHRNHGDHFVVEKYILKIKIENYYNGDDDLDLNIINLVTRKEENLQKANMTKIRGD